METPEDEELAARLAEARRALYRAGADDATRARFEALRCDAERTATAVPPSSGSGAGGEVTRAVRRRTFPVVGVGALLTLVVAAVCAAVLLARVPARLPGLPAALPLGVAIDGDRAVLPALWREARIVAVSDDLDGARSLHAGGRVLLVVRCPADDRSFQVVAGARTAYGACGRPALIPLADGDRVVVTTRGVTPFSAALLSRDAGS